MGREIVGIGFDPAGHFLFELRTDGSYTAIAGVGQAVDLGTWVDDSSTRLTPDQRGTISHVS